MDEERRRAYLAAIGIRLWERRVSSALPVGAEVLASQISAPSLQPAAWTQGALQPTESPSPLSLKPELGDRGRAQLMFSAALAGQGAPGIWRTEGMDWAELESAVRICRACRLWETRTQTVFGIGNRQAELMIIGEAPGADEDARGEPFVGRAGQLLNLMLKAIGLARDQLYIANVLKCRPPGNRDPRPDEALACQGYLNRQIQLVAPRIILALGRISAQYLLHTDTPLHRLRERWFDYGPRQIPLRVTYHPAYLLRSPEQKAKAWDDLTAVKRRLSEEIPAAMTQSAGYLDQNFL
ncbi:uracil-DNA glycosylase [Caldichromatium japonicum]|uniref:Type-4 uracil-DNA glycosylase n=1 Tax=Caldichromatium japonicum TaxID=2699430 RepID=A0A6G7VGE1_9GAMM|nr:uracil-DNA glycosylase [Caldichromatium japonicum]QIK38946.1 uracil-DNA glycosylase [Caldichromatium japonicum]